MLESEVPGPLARHSVRCYLLGRAYAHARSITFDDEALALAALFHDFRLTPAHRDRSRAFMHASAAVLRTFLDARGVARDRADAMSRAIVHHMQPFPRWSFGP